MLIDNYQLGTADQGVRGSPEWSDPDHERRDRQKGKCMKKGDNLTHTVWRKSKNRYTLTQINRYPVLDVINHRDGTKTVTLGKRSAK